MRPTSTKSSINMQGTQHKGDPTNPITHSTPHTHTNHLSCLHPPKIQQYQPSVTPTTSTTHTPKIPTNLAFILKRGCIKYIIGYMLIIIIAQCHMPQQAQPLQIHEPTCHICKHKHVGKTPNHNEIPQKHIPLHGTKIHKSGSHQHNVHLQTTTSNQSSQLHKISKPTQQCFKVHLTHIEHMPRIILACQNVCQITNKTRQQ